MLQLPAYADPSPTAHDLPPSLLSRGDSLQVEVYSMRDARFLATGLGTAIGVALAITACSQGSGERRDTKMPQHTTVALAPAPLSAAAAPSPATAPTGVVPAGASTQPAVLLPDAIAEAQTPRVVPTTRPEQHLT